MDQLMAYEILELTPGSSRKEMREAYARLAKEYHPEEHPEEFNRIQEAYQILTGRGSGENRSTDGREENWFGTREEDTQESENTKTEAASETLKINREETQKSEEVEKSAESVQKMQDVQSWESRFDTFEEQDRRQQREREEAAWKSRMDWQKEQQKLEAQIHQAIQDSLYELETILADKKRRNHAEVYEPFFFRRENKAVMRQNAYVSGLIELLEKYPVKKKVYLELGKIYSRTGEESEKVLLNYLEKKTGKGSTSVPWGAAVFATIGICELDFCCGEQWKTSLPTMIVLVLLLLGLGVLYAVLRMRYSIGISQIWIAGILFWLTLISLITGISDTMFSDAESGIGFMALVWLESALWMAVLGIRAIILKIIKKTKGTEV